ncbi:MAG: hypothetical protein ACRC5M_05085 [Anaeroplasmataceae bacterium]
MKLDRARKIIKIINDLGYEAYIVGGFVRDYVLFNKLDAFDIDLCTNAPTNVILSNFNVINKDSRDVLLTYLIYFEDERFEITQFRSEQYDLISRKPIVKFVNDIDIDYKRRDFTINALYVDGNLALIDKNNFIDDLKNKLIKTIIPVKESFIYDPLRILRGFYLVAKYNFEFTNDIKDFLMNENYNFNSISENRILDELLKILEYDYNFAFNVMVKYNVHLKLGVFSNVIKLFQNKSIKYKELFLCYTILSNTNTKLNLSKHEFNLLNKYKKYKDSNFSLYNLFDEKIQIILYINEMKKIFGYNWVEEEKLISMYNDLVIKTEEELDITNKDIMKIIDRKKINSIKKKIIKSIINLEIKNKYDEIISYIRTSEEYDENYIC